MEKIRNNTIVGICKAGAFYSVEKIENDSCQSQYDFLCNISLTNLDNGNGGYTFTMINQNNEIGIPVGKWKIIEGGISFWWDISRSYFKLMDENGVVTRTIRAGSGNGSARGFLCEVLFRSLFPKAQEIISEFPSAKIYNAYTEFMNDKSLPSKSWFAEVLKDNNPEAILKKIIEELRPHLNTYMEKYGVLKDLLEACDDERAKALLRKATSKCHETLRVLFS